MKQYIMFAHGGSGNHGCEALVRSTIECLTDKNHVFALTSYRPEEDYFYGLDKHCTVSKVGDQISQPKKDINYWHALLELKLRHNYRLMDQIVEAQAAGARRGDIALSIGGDSYCYGKKMTNELIHQHDVWKAAGLKTVLWGCSIEPELLEDQELRTHFADFDLITARERISYEALKRVNPNTLLTVDTAFFLPQKQLPLPEDFEKADFVGINTSPLIERRENKPGITRRNYERLVESILLETDYKSLLIPHVVWSSNDDLSVLRELYEKYKASGRIALIEDHNCMELKGYISRCRFFIGARTHSTIAAYSTGVPTLVLGYSTKSKGIAEDLFGSSDHYVLPVQALQEEDELEQSWKWLQQHESDIRGRLKSVLPHYLERIDNVKETIRKL